MSGQAQIYLHWGDGRRVESQPPKTVSVLRAEGDTATVASEFSESGEEAYSISSGRRLGDDGNPHPWDFWRLRMP